MTRTEFYLREIAIHLYQMGNSFNSLSPEQYQEELERRYREEVKKCQILQELPAAKGVKASKVAQGARVKP